MVFVRWIAVKCRRCERTMVHATPGSRLRLRCQRCKTLQTVDV